jgi:hypothetical protein
VKHFLGTEAARPSGNTKFDRIEGMFVSGGASPQSTTSLKPWFRRVDAKPEKEEWLTNNLSTKSEALVLVLGVTTEEGRMVEVPLGERTFDKEDAASSE